MKDSTRNYLIFMAISGFIAIGCVVIIVIGNATDTFWRLRDCTITGISDCPPTHNGTIHYLVYDNDGIEHPETTHIIRHLCEGGCCYRDVGKYFTCLVNENLKIINVHKHPPVTTLNGVLGSFLTLLVGAMVLVTIGYVDF